MQNTVAPSCELWASKHMTSIFSFLIAILQLRNADGDASDVLAYVSNAPQLAHLLSVALTNKTSYVRKELYTVIFNAQQSSAQRDDLVRDLYAILFQFIVETSNYRLEPSTKDLPLYPDHPYLSQEPCPSYLRTGKRGSTSFP